MIKKYYGLTCLHLMRYIFDRACVFEHTKVEARNPVTCSNAIDHTGKEDRAKRRGNYPLL